MNIILGFVSAKTAIDVTSDEYTIIFEDNTEVILPGDYFFSQYTTISLSNHYGFEFTFSTNPDMTLHVYIMTYDDLLKYKNLQEHYKVKVDRGKSGSGIHRFESTDKWVIVYENDFSETTLTCNLKLLDMGEPPASIFKPWMIAVGSLGVVLVITGLILGVSFISKIW